MIGRRSHSVIRRTGVCANGTSGRCGSSTVSIVVRQWHGCPHQVVIRYRCDSRRSAVSRGGGRTVGGSADAPGAGGIKTHNRNYLHPRGMRLLYELEPGQRTPVFALPAAKLPVVSWYVRLAGDAGGMPTWGVVRVELPLPWFEARKHLDGMAY